MRPGVLAEEGEEKEMSPILRGPQIGFGGAEGGEDPPTPSAPVNRQPGHTHPPHHGPWGVRCRRCPWGGWGPWPQGRGGASWGCPGLG